MDGKKSLRKKESMSSFLKKNPWMFSTFILGVLVLILLIGNFSSGTVSGKQVGEDFVNFINSRGGTQIEYVSYKDFGKDLYQINVLAEGQEVPAHITKDGKYFVQVVLNLEENATSTQTSSSTPVEIVKSDKPVVELFVMTHCPYGTQAEKGLIPTIKALGNLIDVKIRFVHYFMHDPETNETPRQVCIREEQSDKFLPYLECFLEAGDYESCLTEAKVDVSKMEKCISNGNAAKYYEEDSILSQGYGVSGSPTFVVNGIKVDSQKRDSASFLSTICSAFNNAPSECSSLELSSESPSAGFGWGETSAGTTASCG